MRRSREAELVRYRSQCGLLDIDGMDSTTFKLMFRFQKHDFNDLCSALLVPREITTAQNVRLCGREALCVLLRRQAYPNRWCDLEGIFGRHSSVMSCATSRLMDHILSTFGHLLTDVNNHEWISPASLKEFAGAVEDKGSPLPNCWAFIDGTARPICRPKRNQKLYYSGHKRMHMVKYQSLMCPNGIVCQLDGHYPGSWHDASEFFRSPTTHTSLSKQLLLYDKRKCRGILPPICYGANPYQWQTSQKLTLENRIFRETGVYTKLERLTGNEDFVVYGDPAYPLRPLLMKPYGGSHLSPAQQAFNCGMSAVREAV
ncbi:uncharacterized protein LOC119374289 [Rhipicephalus sanguineus]|uniref:uncharacterized protein LOC119374289 n=1 Tax=Rhipicephalus sanguineus TaxID=34632 RepID=UPI0020C22090|nr:uncharacterized protein LOC119374289 [Rhipicephalus sanguineus]